MSSIFRFGASGLPNWAVIPLHAVQAASSLMSLSTMGITTRKFDHEKWAKAIRKPWGAVTGLFKSRCQTTKKRYTNERRCHV